MTPIINRAGSLTSDFDNVVTNAISALSDFLANGLINVAKYTRTDGSLLFAVPLVMVETVRDYLFSSGIVSLDSAYSIPDVGTTTSYTIADGLSRLSSYQYIVLQTFKLEADLMLLLFKRTAVNSCVIFFRQLYGEIFSRTVGCSVVGRSQIRLMKRKRSYF